MNDTTSQMKDLLSIVLYVSIRMGMLRLSRDCEVLGQLQTME